MRHKIISAVLILSLVFLVGSGYTQIMKKTGSSGAAILKVGVGAKAVAMGTAMTTGEGDVNQIFWNPAGIALNTGETQVTFSYNDWIADLDHNAFAAARSFGNLGTFAISGMMAGVTGITANRDTEAGLEGVSYNTGNTFDYNSSYFALAWAKQFTDKLTLGVTGKYYSEKIGFKLELSLYILAGILFFFILEKFVHWRHCHVPTSKSHPHPLGVGGVVEQVELSDLLQLVA